jgi:hypothetical protein
MIKVLSAFIFVFCSSMVCAQMSQKQVLENIDAWYAKHGDLYDLIIDGVKAKAVVTRYHPERPEEKNDIIEIEYKGMKVTLKFMKPLAEISTAADSLQKYFDYVSTHNIYTDIKTPGWPVYPKTGQSAMRGSGVQFSTNSENIDIVITWSVYTVFGYQQSQRCNEQLSISDGSVSDGCMAFRRKNIGLRITFQDLLIK